MSEQKTFMEDLDLWSEATVIGPISSADPKHRDWGAVVEEVKKAIRQKVYQSYRNGQQSALKGGVKGGRHGS